MIQSVRIRNFRSIREITFKPLERGITGILGATGAGKSSILSAVLFALFGVRPDHVTMKDLRRDGSSTSDECSVSVMFENAGQTVEVIREIKGASAKVVANIYVDGIEQSVSTPSTADVWIRNRLGIDATGFMTAFVVRQKELEDIVSAIPSKRKEQIEKLAGIDTLGEALKKARKEENLSKELVKNLPGNREDVEQAEAKLNAYSKNSEEFMANFFNAESALKEKEVALQTLTLKLNDAERRNNKVHQIRNNIANIKGIIEANESLLESVKYVADVSATFDIDKMRAEHKLMYVQVNSHRAELSDLDLSRKNYESSINSLRSQVQSFIPVQEFEHTENDVEALIVELDEKKAELVGKNHQAIARKNDFEESIAQLSHSDDCPTCYTHLDDKQKLIDSLNMSIESLTQEAESCKEQAASVSDRRQEAMRLLNDMREAEIEKQRQIALQKSLEEAEANSFDMSRIDQLKESIASLEAAMAKSAEQGNKAKDIENDRNVYSRTTQILSDNQQKLTESEIMLNELLKSYDPNEFNYLNVELQKISNEHKSVKYKFTLLEQQKLDNEKQIAISESYLKNVSGQWKAKKDLLEKSEKQALTRELLEKYRKDTIASLTPELSENASIMLNDMTSGSFVGVTIGEDFSISVETKAGKVRKVSELSGGEEAAVALSLRLAIAALITGDNQELAWLDEVLTAQDADRRASMLSTIRELSIKQIIMINHTAEAADIADRIVMMENGDIVESSDQSIESKVEASGFYDADDWSSLDED